MFLQRPSSAAMELAARGVGRAQFGHRGASGGKWTTARSDSGPEGRLLHPLAALGNQLQSAVLVIGNPIAIESEHKEANGR
jgi:hypothetical protein